MKEIAVLGVGMHPYGKWPEKNFVEYARVAINDALKDAGVEWKDIQFVAAGATGFSGLGGLLSASLLAEEMGWTGIPVTTNFNACATGAYTLGIARSRILSGECDIALCFGAEWAPKGFFAARETDDPEDPDMLRWKLGLTNPSYFAMLARRRMHEYGTTEEDMARVKVKNSRHGMHNPYARYRKEFTIEDVLNSPMVAYPIRLYGICSTSDGAAAAVLSSTKAAKKYTNKPITIPGIGAVCPEYPYSIIDTPPRLASDSAFSVPVPEFSLYQAIAKKAYEEAGLGPEDIDTADFYDGTGVMELNWYEHFGLCAPGEAERLLNDGDTEIGGRIPVNTSGGLSSLGEAVPAQAISQVAELVWQLRGDAGARQVEGAKVGITANLGAQGSASSVVVKR